MKQFFCLACFILLLGCTQNTKQNGDTKDTGAASTIAKVALPTDTFTVKGKAVVFFSIASQEYTSLANDTTSSIDEVLSDFEYYASEVSDTLQTQGYQTYFTSSRYICITLDNQHQQVFDRLTATPKSITGFVISDGRKKPSVSYGVGTDVEILAFCHDFQRK